VATKHHKPEKPGGSHQKTDRPTRTPKTKKTVEKKEPEKPVEPKKPAVEKKPPKPKHVKKEQVHETAELGKTQESPKTAESMTTEQVKAYTQFSNACKKVYEEHSGEDLDWRLRQLKASPHLIMAISFVVTLHDLLKMYGVMKFNKDVAPTLYESLESIQEKTGQSMPLAKVLLDGIKATKMELLSGVTVHPLPDFKEPEFKTMTKKTPDPAEEPEKTNGPENTDVPAIDPSQNVGPGGPWLDHSNPPEPGTALDEPPVPDEGGGEEVPPEEVPPEEPPAKKKH